MLHTPLRWNGLYVQGGQCANLDLQVDVGQGSARSSGAAMHPIKALLRSARGLKWLPLPLKARPRESDSTQYVNCLYQAAFGRFADNVGRAHWVHRLQSGILLQVVAEDIVRSAEFYTRHGSGENVDKEYLTALYRDGLGRQPDPPGLASWLVQGEKGATRAKVLARFASSGEALERHRRLLVNCLYKAALGRLADADDLARFVRQLQTGASLESVAEDLVGSAEFRRRHGLDKSADADYVTALYRNGLGREPDPEGLASWVAAGREGATQAKVLAQIASSLESLERLFARKPDPGRDPSQLVNCLYKAAFGRPADEGGLALNVHKLLSGLALEAVAEDLVRSAEFQMRHGHSQELDIKYVTALYRDGLGRPPELETLAFWLAKGATRAEVLAEVACSDAALKKVHTPPAEKGTDYSRWVAAHDTISDADRAMIRAHIATLPLRPLISVTMPVSRISEAALRESFNSVVSQLYPYWELCIAVDYLAEPLMKPILLSSAARDRRINFIRPGSLRSRESATNAALSGATGEFVTFLQAGDILPEYALYEAVIAVGGNGQADVVYSDHDHLNSEGQRTNPWFKPGWDPDLLLGQDYVSDLAVYRRTLVEAVGCLRPGFEGAGFHDLALRVTGATTPDRIVHVPAILYHRRDAKNATHSESTVPGLHPVDANRQPARDYLDSRGDRDALVQPAPQIPGAIRVVWPLPVPEPRVSVIVPTRDRADLLAGCLDGVLHRTDYCNLELLIVDNGSVEPTTLRLFDRLSREESAVRILRHPGPFNYSAMNNAAAREAKGEVLLLLNNDVSVIESGWLREMVSQAVRPDVGIVGAKLLYANQQVQHGGVVLGPHGHAAHVHRLTNRNDPGYCGQLAFSRTLSAVTAACAAIRRAVFFEVGGFDEINLPVGFNDIDLCLRLGDYGYRVVWTPFAELFHLESASRGKEDVDPATRERFLREWEHLKTTWGLLLESADPFHNPNLLFHPDYFEMPSSTRREKPWRPLFAQFFDLIDSRPERKLNEYIYHRLP
jgi:O-antigen biosynthesis protein